MITWIRISRLSIHNSLSNETLAGQAAGAAENEARKLPLRPEDQSRKVVLDLRKFQICQLKKDLLLDGGSGFWFAVESKMRFFEGTSKVAARRKLRV